jgi:hypothetical protein
MTGDHPPYHHLYCQCPSCQTPRITYTQPQPTIHDMFMMHAPKEIAPWFKHEMSSPCPEKIVIPEGNMPPGRLKVVNHKEVGEWNAENYKQRQIQWPKAWADEMMKQRLS